MKNVIIIDDEVEMTNLMERFFQRFNDVCVRKFTNSKSALSYIKRNPVDLVLSDITMPNLNGIELLKEVKAHNPVLSVIMMTAEASLDRLLKSHKYDAADFITKPINLVELEKRVQKIL